MSFFEDTKKFINFDTLSYLVEKLRDENQSTYMNSNNHVNNEEIDSLFIPEYLKEDYNPYPNYLTMVALEDGMTAKLSTGQLYEYSIDGGEWISTEGTIETPAINTGQTISFRGELPQGNGVGTFTVTKYYKLTGNCNSLIYKDNAINTPAGQNMTFQNLFSGSETLKFVHKNFLPATTLVMGCYMNMFKNCTSLTTAPALPATTLVSGCYVGMFDGCTSLVSAPELPATTLVSGCYGSMFHNCVKLNYVKMMGIDNISNSCINMLSGVSSTGTFVKNSAATWEDIELIPEGWTVQDAEI